MRLPAKLIGVVVLVFAFSLSSFGFSLMGPNDTFQTIAIGYDQAGVGGPMNISEGYRVNIPILYYAFDNSFLEYFGTNGVTAVENAIQILNAVPPASQIVLGVNGDPNVYVNGQPAPVLSKGLNFQAQTLTLVDLKSLTLANMLNQIGLIGPERWVWCLR